MRTVLSILAASLAVSASPDMPSGTSWSAEARASAMGHAFWTDTTNWNLYDLAGHSSVLPGIGNKPLEMRVGTQGLDASNSDSKTSQGEVAAAQIRGVVEGKAGYRLDLGYSTQQLQVAESPDYKATRLRWGFDLGTAFGPDRLVSMGLGFRARVPSNQTQDSSGFGGAPGEFKRWQPGLEALRVGMGFHFAEAVTLAGKLDASLDVDTLLHAVSPEGYKSMHRFVVARFPIISLSAQLDKSTWPVQAIGDVTFGTTHRIGVMKTVGGAPGSGLPNGANVDFPTLIGDSLRVLAGFLGRWTKDGHTFRPLLTFEAASMRTQAYAPVKGTKDPFSKGEQLLDTGWTRSSESAILGSAYSWDRGLNASLELSSTKKNLLFDKGLVSQEDESHTDLGFSLGLELSHRLVPQWKAKVPSSMEYLLRLGWERKSLSGYEIERGYLAGLTTGYEEPVGGYTGVSSTDLRGWAGQEEYVGLAPTLGGGGDLNLFSFGLGATFLEKVLEVNTAIQTGTWTPDGGDDFSVFGWRAELRWSP